MRCATDDLPARDRVAVWRRHLCDILANVELKPDDSPSGIEGVIVARTLHDLQLLKLTSTATQIIRKACNGEPAGCFLLLVNACGVVAVSSMERQLTLQDGEAVLLDGAQPYTIHRQSTGSSYVVRIPRGRLMQLAFFAESMVMRRLPGVAGSSHLFTTWLDSVLSHADQASPPVQQVSYRHLSDLLAVLLHPGEALAPEIGAAGLAGDDAGGLSAVRLAAAKAYIAERAHDKISIVQVADHLGITQRHVQRLFASQGTTFTAYLNELRLARAYLILRDSASDRLRIRSICFKAGFRDISHFNRAFRARYGCTPAALRKGRSAHVPSWDGDVGD